MTLKSLPPDSRPREKILSRGASALSDAELLAVLLRTGIHGKGVLQMCDELLSLPQGNAVLDVVPGFDGIAGLLYATPDMLQSVKGLGPAKRSIILAVLELARRALAQQLGQRTVLSDPASVKQYVQLHLANRPHEIFAVLFLDRQHRLIAMEEIFRGTLSQTSIFPREIVVRALHHHASAVVLAHNHPSGTVRPSREDEVVTHTLTETLSMIDVRVLDHIIVAPGLALSMAEEGLI